MEPDSRPLLHHLAAVYRLFLADLPGGLRAEHLDVPRGEQAGLLAGLEALRAAIGGIYDHYASVDESGVRWRKAETCVNAIEGPALMLLALGSAGELAAGAGGDEITISRSDLEPAMKRMGAQDRKFALAALSSVGIDAGFLGADGASCEGGLRDCSSVVFRSTSTTQPVLRALAHFGPRVPRNVGTHKGIIHEIFLRGDLRPLIPGYSVHTPHLPVDDDEVYRTLSPEVQILWREIRDFMAARHPECRIFYRVPRIRARSWVADFSPKEGDYGLWSVVLEEKGLYVRIVLRRSDIECLRDHIGLLTPRFRADYLARVACRDCSHCGKHVILEEGGRAHRLCKSPWYYSPYLRREDLPDIEHLVDVRLAEVH